MIFLFPHILKYTLSVIYLAYCWEVCGATHSQSAHLFLKLCIIPLNRRYQMTFACATHAWHLSCPGANRHSCHRLYSRWGDMPYWVKAKERKRYEGFVHGKQTNITEECETVNPMLQKQSCHFTMKRYECVVFSFGDFFWRSWPYCTIICVFYLCDLYLVKAPFSLIHDSGFASFIKMKK